MAVGSMSRYLLLLACSQRKSAEPGYLPAIERYDGVNYRVVKKAMRDGNCPKGLEILIISAKHGLINASTLIEDYDLLMTLQRADELRQSTTAELNVLLQQQDPQEIFVNMGRIYLAAIEPDSELFQPCRRLHVAKGGIGSKMSQMKLWLHGTSVG